MLSGTVDQILCIKRCAVGLSAFGGGLCLGHDEQRCDIHQQPHAREQRHQYPQYTHPHHVDTEVGSKAGAYTAEQLSLSEAIETPWLLAWASGGSKALLGCVCRGIALGPSCLLIATGYRAHLAQDLAHFCCGDHILVGAQKAVALVSDSLFQIGQDFLPVRIVGQASLGSGHVVAQRRIALVLDLVSVVVQIDCDDLAHVSVPAYGSCG